jgi:hypothetical protein
VRTDRLPAAVTVALLLLAACRPSAPGAVDRCLAAARSTNAPGGSRSLAGEIASACADVYKQPACADAQRRFDEAPVESRAITLARRCRDAYCPVLPEPKPRLCLAEPANPSELAVSWQELVGAALQRDLGADEADRLLTGLRNAGRERMERRSR